jgi:two-component system response regulator AtoC
MAERRRITIPVDEPTRGAGARPVALRIVNTGRELRLPEDRAVVRVGSDADNEIVLDDRFVSAVHCTLERRAGGLVVRDRGSRNGTRVNGASVRDCEVGPGARITVGNTTLLVLGPPTAAARPAAEELVSEDPAFRAALEMAARAARSSANIVILGESGTGKELVARLVHEASPQAGGPFVALNCGAIPRDLVESELFGHERGAFTGANERRLGLFEQAQGGTLFLDEIGELPLAQQPRLLRVLETRRLRRLGATEERVLDVRVVAATHRDLRAHVGSGAFRADLYHRLATVEVRLPPLRERQCDVVLLARRFLDDLEPQVGRRTLSPDALAALQGHAWPGNVRELRNAVLRAALLGEGELRAAELLSHVTGPEPPLDVAPRAEDPAVNLDDAVRDLIARALQRHRTVRGAARAIGMAKSTLHDRVRRYGLRRDED